MLLLQLFLGGILILVTVVIQALSFDRIIKLAVFWERMATRKNRHFWRLVTLNIVIIGVGATLISHIWIWALFYLAVDPDISDLEVALYFSTSSYTTVGFGDVYLGKEWRLISSIEAMNGFLMFGWATAFIFEIVNNLYRREGKAISDHHARPPSS